MPGPSDHTPAALLRKRWNTLLQFRTACLQHDDLDTVHDLRVATRRLRSALQLFDSFFGDHLLERVSGSIRRLTRGVGELRNLDEALLFFRKECCSTADDAPLFAALLETLQLRRAEESAHVRKLLKRLDVDGIGRIMKQLEHRHSSGGRRCARADKTGSLPGYLSETSISLFSKVDHLLPFALATEAVETRHLLRIAIKHWRYFLEIVAELSAQDYGPILENLKHYQSVLGTLNDLSVFSALADAHALSAGERNRFNEVAAARTAESYGAFVALVQQQPLRYHFLY